MRRIVSLCAAIALALASSLSFAAATTFEVTATFTAPATDATHSAATGYRAYQACAVSGQTSTGLIGTVTSGTKFTFAGDTANTYNICVRSFNSAGEGPILAGSMATITVTPPVNPPNGVNATFICNLNTVNGGTCVVAP